jgi:serine/threonine protein kinase
MTLAAGTRLGPYEILAPLGAGGMGEVYRARDSKLDRDIAIKVLPESVSSDPEALARFEREAKANWPPDRATEKTKTHAIRAKFRPRFVPLAANTA